MARYSRESSIALGLAGSGSGSGSALTHSAPPMSAWPLPNRARYSPRSMKASAPVGSSAESPRRATVPIVPYFPSIRGTSRISRLPWRAASMAALAVSPSTARVTVMCGRTTTSSMGMTGSSSLVGILGSPGSTGFITKERFSHPGTFPIAQGNSGSRPPRGALGESLDPGGAPGGRASLGHGVDRDRRQQDQARDDEDPLHVPGLQIHAVVDAADQQAAKDSVDDLAAAAEQARTADDRGGDGEEDELAALDVVGHAPDVRGIENDADAGRHRAEGEGDGPNHGQVDAGPACGFGVAADRVYGAPKLRPLEQDRPDAQDTEHDWDRPRHTGQGPEVGAVDVGDGHDDNPGGRDQADLQDGQAHRRGHEPAPTPPLIRKPQESPESQDNQRHGDPAHRRIDRARHQVEQHLGVGALAARDERIARPGSKQQQDQHHAVEDQEAGECDDERRYA